jgi:hypothetical protein
MEDENLNYRYWETFPFVSFCVSYKVINTLFSITLFHVRFDSIIDKSDPMNHVHIDLRLYHKP